MTRGRVGEAELQKYGEQLFNDPVVREQDFGQYSRGERLKQLEKDSRKIKDPQGKFDAEENIKVAKEMFGLEEKK